MYVYVFKVCKKLLLFLQTLWAKSLSKKTKELCCVAALESQTISLW